MNSLSTFPGFVTFYYCLFFSKWSSPATTHLVIKCKNSCKSSTLYMRLLMMMRYLGLRRTYETLHGKNWWWKKSLSWCFFDDEKIKRKRREGRNRIETFPNVSELCAAAQLVVLVYIFVNIIMYLCTYLHKLSLHSQYMDGFYFPHHCCPFPFFERKSAHDITRGKWESLLSSCFPRGFTLSLVVNNEGTLEKKNVVFLYVYKVGTQLVLLSFCYVLVGM